MIINLIKEWLDTFDPENDRETFDRYSTLIHEEDSELTSAVNALEHNGTLEDVHKEAADLVWVALCRALKVCSVHDLERALIAVYNSNMSKRCADEFHAKEWIALQDLDNQASVYREGNHYVIRRNEDGKVLKGPNYAPARITIKD